MTENQPYATIETVLDSINSITPLYMGFMNDEIRDTSYKKRCARINNIKKILKSHRNDIANLVSDEKLLEAKTDPKEDLVDIINQAYKVVESSDVKDDVKCFLIGYLQCGEKEGLGNYLAGIGYALKIVRAIKESYVDPKKVCFTDIKKGGVTGLCDLLRLKYPAQNKRGRTFDVPEHIPDEELKENVPNYLKKYSKL